MGERNILVVEDEAKISGLLKDYLEKAGYRVCCLDRGDQVLNHVKKDPSDLIIDGDSYIEASEVPEAPAE